MSTTIIDALLITLGLDASNLVKNADVANKAQKKIADQAKHSNKEVEELEKRQAKAREIRAKELERHSKAMANGLNKIRNEALGLLGLFTAGMGIKQFAVNTVIAGANIGRLADNLGMSTEKLSAYGQVAERAGGSVEGMNAQLKEASDEIARMRTMGGASPAQLAFLRADGNPKAFASPQTWLDARMDIIDRIYNKEKDPSRAMFVAKSMNIGDDNFNAFKNGSAAFHRQVAVRENKARFTRKDAANSAKLQNEMQDLNQGLERGATKLLLKAEPALIALTTALNRFVDWIDKSSKGGFMADLFDLMGAHKGPDGAMVFPDALQGSSLKYDNPHLNNYAAIVEKRLGLPDGMLKNAKDAERSDSRTVSSKGATGTMQFMPDAWKKYGSGNATDAYASLDAAGLMLRDLLKQNGGDIPRALAAYKKAQGGSPNDVKNYLDRILPEIGKGNAAAAANMTERAAASPRGSSGGNNTTSSADVKINTINVNTQATDPVGIAKEIGPAVTKYAFAYQANTGFVA